MSLSTTRAQRRELERENAGWPVQLVEVPRDQWPADLQRSGRHRAVYRSREFLVQVYREQDLGVRVRLSICRTSVTGDRWQEGISWDELQRLKRECGYGDCDAVEIFPRDRDVVNVANMRHLWVLDEPLPFTWRAENATTGNDRQDSGKPTTPAIKDGL